MSDISYVSPMTDSTFHLTSELGAVLRSQNAYVTTAESCTGGGVAAALTDVPGSSEWFEGGFVTYSNRLKQEVLSVPETLIDTHGAVSEPVALAMLDGALQVADADLGVALSGIAGPGGGTDTKPVGTVCIAVGGPRGKRVHTYIFQGERAAVREQSVLKALQLLLEETAKTKNTV